MSAHSAHATSYRDGTGDWRDVAACRDHDPELWFPHDTDTAGIAAAKAVCRGCPSRRACLEWALGHRMTHGIWGGLDEHERESLRRRRVRRG